MREAYAIGNLEPSECPGCGYGRPELWFVDGDWVSNGHWMIRWRANIPSHVRKKCMGGLIGRLVIGDLAELSHPIIVDGDAATVIAEGGGKRRRLTSDYVPLLTGLEIRWAAHPDSCDERRDMIVGLDDDEIVAVIMPWRRAEGDV